MKEEEREARIRREQDFYAKCGEILDIDHDYHRPFSKRTRWNARTIGNGRYPGFGVIRRYSDTLIHVVSRHGSKEFKSETDVYAYLGEVKTR